MGNLGKFLGVVLFSMIVTSCADKNDHLQSIDMEANSVSEDSLLPTKETQCIDSEIRFNLKRAAIHLKQTLHKTTRYSCEGEKIEEKWVESESPKEEIEFPPIKNKDAKYYSPEYHVINSATCDKVVIREEKAMKPRVVVDFNADTAGLHVVKGLNVIQYEASVCSPSKMECKKRVVIEQGTFVIAVDYTQTIGKDKSEYDFCNMAF